MNCFVAKLKCGIVVEYNNTDDDYRKVLPYSNKYS